MPPNSGKPLALCEECGKEPARYYMIHPEMSGGTRPIRRISLLSGAVLLGAAVALLLVVRASSAAKAEPGCPFYPGAEVARSSDGVTTYLTGDAFGQVLKWYEGQHRRKGEVEVAPPRPPISGDVTASYSLVIRHGDRGQRYLVTVYKFRGDSHSLVDVADAE